MCGLAGVASIAPLRKDDLYDLDVLTTLSTLRGVDSADMFTVNKKQPGKHEGPNLVHSRKTLENGVSLLSDIRNRKHVFSTDPHTIAVHCRAATCGDITYANCHPFTIGKLIGMHNGTVPNFAPSKKNEDKDSDSQEFFRRINSKGLEQAVLDADQGAWALVWTDLKDGTLNFLRNFDRTLYYVENDGVIFWASEFSFLSFMVHRSEKKDWGKITPFDANIHYKMTLGTVEFSSKTHIPLAPVPVSTTDCGSGWAPWAEGTADLSNMMRKAHSVIDAIPEFQLCYRGYGDKVINKKRAMALLNEGCANCGVVHEMDEEVMWINHNDYICDHCIGHDFVQQNIINHGMGCTKSMLILPSEDVNNAH